MAVSVSSPDPTDPAQVALVLEATRDQALTHDTYLPAGLDEDGCGAWLAQLACAWVVMVDDEPAGMVVAHDAPDPGDGVSVPPGSVELEWWLLPRHRGRGVLGAALQLVEPDLGRRWATAVAVVWEENLAGLRAAAQAGYSPVGRSWWSDDESQGWCQVWSRPLATRP